jgi:hypothetical protein
MLVEALEYLLNRVATPVHKTKATQQYLTAQVASVAIAYRIVAPGISEGKGIKVMLSFLPACADACLFGLLYMWFRGFEDT